MSLLTLIDAYLKVDKIDDALKILNKTVDRCFKVVATLANRVFNELIKNSKAMNYPCQTPLAMRLSSRDCAVKVCWMKAESCRT